MSSRFMYWQFVLLLFFMDFTRGIFIQERILSINIHLTIYLKLFFLFCFLNIASEYLCLFNSSL